MKQVNDNEKAPPETPGRNGGFTLIELLIVVAIIGILAAIAIPQFSVYRIKGHNAAAVADLKHLKTSLEAYFTEYNKYPSAIN